MKKILNGLIFVLLAYFPVAWAAASQPLTVEQFIDKMVQAHHYDRDQLVQLFQRTEYLPEVIDRMNKPFEEKPWDFYRDFFITADRVTGGVQYWHAHAATLTRASQQYGVPPALIVAIIGIESNYGQQPSKYPELRTLATLSFHYPKRGAFFQNELEHYLLLTREYHLPPVALYGSYAGALGIPQFMPSTYRQYAVSYDGKPSVNLLENHDDAIASIASYLQKSGWQPHQPVAVPALIPANSKSWLISADAKPVYRMKTLKKFGVRSALPVSAQRKAAVIAMYSTNSQEYWVTFQNFYAIMAYNPRTTYAMAIYQLSEAIQKEYEQGTAKKSPTIAASR